MENFTYVNIFETKGLEYLFVIGFLVLFIMFIRFALYGASNQSSELDSMVKVSIKPKGLLKEVES